MRFITGYPISGPGVQKTFPATTTYHGRGLMVMWRHGGHHSTLLFFDAYTQHRMILGNTVTTKQILTCKGNLLFGALVAQCAARVNYTFTNFGKRLHWRVLAGTVPIIVNFRQSQDPSKYPVA